VHHHHQPATIAILGADTVVGRALCLLLEGSGYRTTLLDAYPTGVVDELLDGAHLLLLVPRLDEGVREAFVGAIGKRDPQKAHMPVISLSSIREEAPPAERVLSVPWPSAIEELVGQVEATMKAAVGAGELVQEGE
jgi:hypothetical protein